MALIEILLIVGIIAWIIFSLWVLVDIANKINKKWGWLIIILLLPILGNILYYFFGRGRRR